MADLPSIDSVDPDQRLQLLLTKLKECETICDFSNPRAQCSLKEAKRRHLVDLVEYIHANRGVFNEMTYEPFMRMISENVLRSLPPGTFVDQVYEPEEDEPGIEPSWPHLQLVYEVLRKFVVSNDTDSKLARSHISFEFVNGMMELFNSEDSRERESLKTIIHRIYGKVMPLRGPIRASVMNVFHRVVYNGERFNGLAELLEILGSIINGFAVPLKEEHKDLLRRGIMPLHIPSSMPSYHVQLSFCVAQYTEKEPQLAQEMLDFLLRHWPTTHSRKEIMLLNEIEELLELIRPEDLGTMAEPLFRRVGLCMASPHFQVAERALFYWNNEYIVNLIMQYRDEVLPAMVGPLTRNIESHWNANVLSLSCNVQRLLCEMDEKLFQRSSDKYEEELLAQQKKDAERRRRWRQVCQIAETRTQRLAAEDRKNVEDEGDGESERNYAKMANGDGNEKKGQGLKQGISKEKDDGRHGGSNHESDGIRKATRLLHHGEKRCGGSVEQDARC